MVQGNWLLISKCLSHCVCVQAKNVLTNEVVAVKKMQFSGKQAMEVS